MSYMSTVSTSLPSVPLPTPIPPMLVLHNSCKEKPGQYFYCLQLNSSISSNPVQWNKMVDLIWDICLCFQYQWQLIQIQWVGNTHILGNSGSKISISKLQVSWEDNTKVLGALHLPPWDSESVVLEKGLTYYGVICDARNLKEVIPL